MGTKIILKKELTKMLKNPPSDLFVVRGLVNDNLQHWEIFIVGPPNTVYENGIYKAELKFPDDYPIRPPTLRFKSKLHHPNIYLDGKVCISTLQIGQDGKDFGQYWRPVLGIEQAVLSVISLFDDPNIEDPANTAAANQFKKDKAAYEQRCRTLAVESLKFLPKDFEHPSEIYKRLKKVREEKERERARKEVEDSEEVYVDDDEDLWEYDFEDISEESEDSGSDDDDDYDDDDDDDEVHMQASDDEEEEEGEDEALIEIDAEDEHFPRLSDRYEECDTAESLYCISINEQQPRKRGSFSRFVRVVRRKSKPKELLNSPRKKPASKRIPSLAQLLHDIKSLSKRLRSRI